MTIASDKYISCCLSIWHFQVIELLSQYCDGPAKKANTVLEENELNILFDALTQKNSVDDLSKYLVKPKKPKKAEAKAEKAATEADNTKKAVKKINSNIEKATLGDIDALAALKSQLEKGK